MTKCAFLFMLILFSTGIMSAQNASEAVRDSLLNLLDENSETTDQVDLLCQLSDAFYRSNTSIQKDSSLLFSTKANALAEKLNYDEGRAEALYDLGKYHIGIKNSPADATDFLLQSLELFSSFNDDAGVSKCYMQLGLISYMLEYYEDAVLNFRNSLNASNNDFSTYLMALSYIELDSMDLAKKYFSKAITSYADQNNTYRLSECYLYLGKLYLKTATLDSASHYINKALDVRSTTAEDPYSFSRPYSFLAEVYLKSGDPDKAIEYGQLCFALEDSKKNPRDEINITQAAKVLAAAYEEKGSYEEAHRYLKIFNKANDNLTAGSLKQKVADMKSMFAFEQEMNLQKLSQQKDRELAEAEISKERLFRNAVTVGSILLLILLILMFNRYKIKRDSEKTLLELNEVISLEKQRSDDLLLNILPEDVAEELKSKGEADAREYETVSILFSDFKEFTRKSELFSPKELVAEIGACFQAFDGIMEKYSVEKIKTIGDAYMAACGLSNQKGNPIKDTVDAALEMQEFIRQRKAAMDDKGVPAFEMRIGIHAGPVVAGIVGVKKFQYDLWGDTVNTASRIESSGEVGKVNISRAAYDAIKDEKGYVFESRGKIEAKGKGDVEMWFVSKA
jgi:class 3 adenylate cyclase